MRQLPPESATATALRLEGSGLVPTGPPPDPDAEQWSRVEHLLAAIRDEAHFLRYSYLSSHSKHSLRWKPEPLPRPGIKPKKKREALTSPQANALYDHLRRTQYAADN